MLLGGTCTQASAEADAHARTHLHLLRQRQALEPPLHPVVRVLALWRLHCLELQGQRCRQWVCAQLVCAACHLMLALALATQPQVQPHLLQCLDGQLGHVAPQLLIPC